MAAHSAKRRSASIGSIAQHRRGLVVQPPVDRTRQFDGAHVDLGAEHHAAGMFERGVVDRVTDPQQRAVEVEKGEDLVVSGHGRILFAPVPADLGRGADLLRARAPIDLPSAPGGAPPQANRHRRHRSGRSDRGK